MHRMEFGPGWPSFAKVMDMAKMAKEIGEPVIGEVLGKDVIVNPDDNPHEVYNKQGFYTPGKHYGGVYY